MGVCISDEDKQFIFVMTEADEEEIEVTKGMTLNQFRLQIEDIFGIMIEDQDIRINDELCEEPEDTLMEDLEIMDDDMVVVYDINDLPEEELVGMDLVEEKKRSPSEEMPEILPTFTKVPKYACLHIKYKSDKLNVYVENRITIEELKKISRQLFNIQDKELFFIYQNKNLDDSFVLFSANIESDEVIELKPESDLPYTNPNGEANLFEIWNEDNKGVIQVKEECTVQEVKFICSSLWNLKPYKHELFYRGKALKRHDPICDYDFAPNTVLYFEKEKPDSYVKWQRNKIIRCSVNDIPSAIITYDEQIVKDLKYILTPPDKTFNGFKVRINNLKDDDVDDNTELIDVDEKNSLKISVPNDYIVEPKGATIARPKVTEAPRPPPRPRPPVSSSSSSSSSEDEESKKLVEVPKVKMPSPLKLDKPKTIDDDDVKIEVVQSQQKRPDDNKPQPKLNVFGAVIKEEISSGSESDSESDENVEVKKKNKTNTEVTTNKVVNNDGKRVIIEETVTTTTKTVVTQVVTNKNNTKVEQSSSDSEKARGEEVSNKQPPRKPQNDDEHIIAVAETKKEGPSRPPSQQPRSRPPPRVDVQNVPPPITEVKSRPPPKTEIKSRPPPQKTEVKSRPPPPKPTTVKSRPPAPKN